MIITLIFIYPIFINFNYFGIEDWDQHEFYHAVPRKTILEYKQFPLWNPYYCGGNVMLANPQSAFLSPLYLSILLFGVIHGIKLNFLFFLVLGMFGMYLLTRYLKITKIGAYLSSFVFGLSGVYASFIAIGYTTFFPIAYIPWVFYYFLKSLKDIRYFVICAFFLVLMIFAGGVYILPFTLLFLFVWILLDSLKKKDFSSIKLFLIILILVFIMASIKLIPTIEFLSENLIINEADPGFDTKTLIKSLMYKPSDLDSDYFNRLTWRWYEYYSYIGVVVLILSILGAIIIFKKMWPLVITSLIFVILSYGTNSYLPLWEILSLFPVFSSLHVPSRFIIIVIFCFSIFAGFFISKLEREKKVQKILLYFIILYITFDLISTNNFVFYNAFSIKPLDIIPNKEFHQTWDYGIFYNKLPFNIEPQDTVPKFHQILDERGLNNKLPRNYIVDPISRLYPFFLKNLGTINCFEPSHLPIRAKPIQDKDYKGEVYYLNSNKNPKIIRFTPNKIKIKVNVTKPDLLVINQNYDAGWHIKDGKVMSYNGLISTIIFPSDNIINLYYLPSSFLLGLSLTILGSIFALIFYFNSDFRRKLIKFLRVKMIKKLMQV